MPVWQHEVALSRPRQTTARLESSTGTAGRWMLSSQVHPGMTWQTASSGSWRSWEPAAWLTAWHHVSLPCARVLRTVQSSASNCKPLCKMPHSSSPAAQALSQAAEIQVAFLYSQPTSLSSVSGSIWLGRLPCSTTSHLFAALSCRHVQNWEAHLLYTRPTTVSRSSRVRLSRVDSSGSCTSRSRLHWRAVSAMVAQMAGALLPSRSVW